MDNVNDSVYSKAQSLDLSKNHKLQTNCKKNPQSLLTRKKQTLRRTPSWLVSFLALNRSTNLNSPSAFKQKIYLVRTICFRQHVHEDHLNFFEVCLKKKLSNCQMSSYSLTVRTVKNWQGLKFLQITRRAKLQRLWRKGNSFYRKHRRDFNSLRSISLPKKYSCPKNFVVRWNWLELISWKILSPAG